MGVWGSRDGLSALFFFLFFIFHFLDYGFLGGAPHHVISCLLGPSQITSLREDESPRIISNYALSK